MMMILQQLICALRNELQQYGEMLALLDQPQEPGRLRGPDDMLLFISTINAQSNAIQDSRTARESLRKQLAQSLKQPDHAGFGQLTPLLPEQYRPLIAALVDENNELLCRVRHRAEENQVVLRRSLDLMQRFLTTLSPREGSGSHDAPTEFITGPPESALYQAIA